MKKILILGYFGYVTNQLDGQTVKTRNIQKLVNIYGENFIVDEFDTQVLKYNKFKLFTMIYKVMCCNTLLYLPAHNNLKKFFPILYVISKFFKIDILYIVVGGWLADFLKVNTGLIDKLLKIKHIFCENEQIKSTLFSEYGFNNVSVIPNFRILDDVQVFSKCNKEFKVVFMSRIHPMKGIDVVFDIAKRMQNVKFDFYGPISEEAVNFTTDIEKHNNTKYFGELLPENINRTLSNYDVLVLPTRYKTEGFPGAVLDAYMAGIPVVVSDWLYAKEFVDNGETGYICKMDDVDEFVEAIETLRADNNLLNKLKRNAINKSEQYSPKSAWEILSNYL